MIKGIVILIMLELLAPVLFGLVFALSDKNVTGRKHLLISSFVNGQILLYALFQPITVFSVFKKKRLTYNTKVFIIAACVVLLVLIVILAARYLKRLKTVLTNPLEKVSFWGVAAVLVFVFMMIMSFFMMYTDGDDAYYVTTAAEAVASDTLYAKDPYTGTGTVSSLRYMSAPYPIWIAFLAYVSGLHVTAVAHSFFPWTIILLSFSVLFLMARSLFEGDTKKRGIFLFFSSILILFGDYSIYSPENFLLARARQGKAALAAFMLPYIVCLLICIAKELEKTGKITLRNLILITFAGFAASLCSTIGGALCLALVGLTALCFAFVYKNIKYPLLMILMNLPAEAFVLLYLVKR